jgi:hypothetical protein
MKDLNRSVLFILPNERYLNWIRTLSGCSQLTLEELQQEGSAYLVDDALHGRDAEKLIRKHWREVFEHELWGWSTVRKEWPKKRSLKMFREFFDVGFSSFCLDLADGKIEPK